MASRILAACVASVIVLASCTAGGSRIAGPTSGATAERIGEAAPNALRRDAHRHGRVPRHLVEEAKGALGAILTGEQVYLQKFGAFANAADTAGLRISLGVVLDAPSRHWSFAVTEASENGFVAAARGRESTEAQGLTVTLLYVRGRAPVWTVRRDS